MSSPARNVAVFGVMVVIGFGAYWLGRQQGETSVLAAKLAAVSVAPKVSDLQEENARLVAENERLAKQAAAQMASGAALAAPEATVPRATSLGRLHLLAELQQKHLASIILTPLGRDGRLQGNFTELFDLTPAEKNSLQQAIDQARQQIDQAATASASVSRRAPDGPVVISVPVSPSGPAIRDTMMNTFADILGPERNDAFLAINQSSPSGQLANAMNGFGTDERTITVARTASSPGSRSRIVVQDAHPNGAGGSSVTLVSDLSELPENLRWLSPLIPADF